LVREGFKLLVRGILGDITFLEAGDGDTLLAVVAQTPATRLVLVDVTMPGMQGGRLLLELACERPDIPIVVISTMNAPAVIRQIMSIKSVHAFVHKSAGIATMRVAIEAAMAGRKLELVYPQNREARADLTLTPRQEEIRDLLRLGMSNKAIADSLGISTNTVKNHITEIFKVLNATNRTQVARLTDPK
jgi:DNA-binding NarL/FixJ family response regulator